ncbi:MAG: response regulator [Candidatus Cloacimonetes bacterium]|nr:response regulator [Candidatus Cloacimonadota bacterium]
MTGKKILVVEDNPINMELVVFLLETNGYSVLKATSAKEGIEIAKKETPDLILMDIGLPGMNGLVAAKILKNDTRTKKIPIIATTSHAMKGDEEEIRNAGCEGYITKPINTREFPKEIARYLGSF